MGQPDIIAVHAPCKSSVHVMQMLSMPSNALQLTQKPLIFIFLKSWL